MSGFTPAERSVCRLVCTPIGNLGDMTPRAVEAIREADILFAEDTRTAKALLHHLGISKSVESYHKDNEATAAESALRAINNGSKIAVISEAGMPGVSDPGFVLIRKLMEQGLPFEIVPGVSAAVHASVASGLCKDGTYLFAGFLPHKRAVKEIVKLAQIPYPIVIYESPHRIKDTLKELFEHFTPPIAICRELTKLHEEVVWLHTPADINNVTAKGEFCIVVNNSIKQLAEDSTTLTITPEKLVELLKNGNVNTKTIVEILKECGMKRNEAYDLAQQAKSE